MAVRRIITKSTPLVSSCAKVPRDGGRPPVNGRPARRITHLTFVIARASSGCKTRASNWRQRHERKEDSVGRPWRERVESADWSAVTRHRVSAIRSGERHTLALVFHDAA
ncbi:hypothetical protein GCM10027298_23090 [Epidermidibacterium keratini]